MVARRIRRVREEAPTEDMVLNRVLQLIALKEDEAASIKKALAELYTEAERLMESARRKTYEYRMPDRTVLAGYVSPKGRASSRVDPAALRKVVKDDNDFYACVEVVIGKAKQILPGKVLNAITDKIDPVPGAPKFTVSVVKDGSR
jgi:hypothetical protein